MTYIVSNHTTSAERTGEHMVINTIAGGPGYWLQLIDAALWLLATNKDSRCVEIIMHYKRGVALPLVGRLGVLVSPRRLMAAIAKRSELGGNAPVALDLGAPAAVPGSIYDRVMNSADGITLNMALGEVRLRKAVTPLLADRASLLRAFAATAQLWLRSLEWGRFSPMKFLRASYQGVVVGDLVASNALKYFPKAGGSLREVPRLGLLSQLFEAVCLLRYMQGVLIGSRQHACVMISEPTYLDGLYQRAGRAMGLSILEWQDYGIPYDLIPLDRPMPNPRVVRPIGRPLSESEVARAEQYLRERVEDSSKHLYYMTVGANAEDGLYDPDGKAIETEAGKLYAVLFLHSFDDGQYWFGVDGFEDIFHWTRFTIDRLIENEAIAKVFIKTHPNVHYSEYPGDKVALDKIVDKYGSEPKVGWVKSNCRVSAFGKQKGRFFGITHHGSVAEELAHMGVPVAGSSFSPWGKNYHFVTTWETPDEYLELLRKIPSRVGSLSEVQRESLHEFVTSYRLESVDGHNRYAWLKFARFVNATHVSGDIELAAARAVDERLRRWKPDSPDFLGFVNYLVAERYRKSEFVPSQCRT